MVKKYGSGAWKYDELNTSVYDTVTYHHMIMMMTSSNGSIFRVTGPLCGEFTGPRWIPHTKASDAELWWFLWLMICARINGWVNNGEAGDLRRSRAHFDHHRDDYTLLSTRKWCITPFIFVVDSTIPSPFTTARQCIYIDPYSATLNKNMFSRFLSHLAPRSELTHWPLGCVAAFLKA